MQDFEFYISKIVDWIISTNNNNNNKLKLPITTKTNEKIVVLI